MHMVATNAIDRATSSSASFGFIPVPGKGGKTTNFEIPDKIQAREIEEYLDKKKSL